MAGTVVLTSLRAEGVVRYARITCTADAANGSFPATSFTSLGVHMDGTILALQTNPGATAPTDNYDITLIDADGLDRLNGVGANRDQANSERVAITGSPVVGHGETLTLTIENNAVNSAIIVITIYWTAAVSVAGASNAAGGGTSDATAANQVSEIAELTSANGTLTTIDADTGNIVTHLVTLLAALGTTNAVAAADAAGFPGMAIRDDALSALGVAEGDWAPLRVDVNGALFVQLAGVLSATNDSIAVGAATTGGATFGTNADLIDVDESETAIKASAGTLYGFIFTNVATSARFVKFYNDTVANVIVGTTAPALTIAIPAGTGVVMPCAAPGVAFSAAITIAATTGVAASDTGAPGANEVIGTVFYK